MKKHDENKNILEDRKVSVEIKTRELEFLENKINEKAKFYEKNIEKHNQNVKDHLEEVSKCEKCIQEHEQNLKKYDENRKILEDEKVTVVIKTRELELLENKIN